MNARQREAELLLRRSLALFNDQPRFGTRDRAEDSYKVAHSIDVYFARRPTWFQRVTQFVGMLVLAGIAVAIFVAVQQVAP